MAKQRILLVDDHEVVRLGLKSLLDRHPQFDVVGEAASAREAMEQVNALSPDVVVMDIRLPGTSGIEACEDIIQKHPGIKVLMLTSYAEDEMLFSEASAFAHLSQQEKHVLLLVSEGKTNREIAKALFLGEGTVRNYVSSILSKLGVNNRAEAAAYAVEHSLREYISN
jgi:two-component system response regulator DevR